MSKQQNLKIHRNYLENPRRSTEFDPEYREDFSHFDISRTKQADAADADINNIMKRYANDMANVPPPETQQLFGDFSDPDSFREAQEIMAHANSQFAALPAETRAFFHNDPARMLEYVNDAPNDIKKGNKLFELGLVKIRPEKPETPEQILKDIRDDQRKARKTSDKPDSGA